MTSPAPDPSLEPVRRALVEAARADAARAVATASADAEATRSRAAATEQEIRDRARASGEAEGALEMVTRRRHARMQAQATVLSAQRDAYEELRDRVRARLVALRDDPSYPELRERLVRRARAALGTEARVVDVPEGGVVATTDGRSMRLSLPALADQALESLGPELEGLWAP